MAVNTKKKNRKTNAIVSDEVGDYSNDPFVIRKTEAAKRTLEKYGLPKELLPDNKEDNKKEAG